MGLTKKPLQTRPPQCELGPEALLAEHAARKTKLRQVAPSNADALVGAAKRVLAHVLAYRSDFELRATMQLIDRNDARRSGRVEDELLPLSQPRQSGNADKRTWIGAKLTSSDWTRIRVVKNGAVEKHGRFKNLKANL